MKVFICCNAQLLFPLPGTIWIQFVSFKGCSSYLVVFHFQELFQNSSMQLSGPIRFAHQWIDMSKRKVIKISQIQLSSFFTDRITSCSDTIDFATRLYWYTAVVEITDRGFFEVFWQIHWGGSWGAPEVVIHCIFITRRFQGVLEVFSSCPPCASMLI